jgi:RNA polymerase sigma-70 factor (ECF subfamily)
MGNAFPLQYRVCYNHALAKPGSCRLPATYTGRSAASFAIKNLFGGQVAVQLSLRGNCLSANPFHKTTEHPFVVHDDLNLLERVRRLDPAALEEVHDTFYPAIFRYISYRVGDLQTAEDLTSEVFTRLLSAVRDRSAPKNTLKGWLYGVASRVVADHHRKSYRIQQVELSQAIESSTPGPAEAVSNKQNLEALHVAMKELTQDQQEVIALRFGYEMPIREVAQLMGKSEGAIKQLQARAVASLSRILAIRSNRQ